MKMAKAKFYFDCLNAPTDYSINQRFFKTTSEKVVAVKDCYGKAERIKFNSPNMSIFYMKTLKKLGDGPADDFELGVKAIIPYNVGNYKTTLTVRKNTGMLGAMRKAGLISYSRKANKWSITEVGKRFYKEAIKYIENN